MKKYIHIMHNEKFIVPYIEFIKDNFNFKEHEFYLIDGKKFRIPLYKNIFIYKSDKNINLFITIIKLWIFLYQILKKEKKIYFHGLFDKRIILFLFIFRNFLKKSHWIIWGGDLYCYKDRKNKLINRIWYSIENYVKSNFYGYVTHVQGDYELIKEWYGTKGKYYNCFIYPSNLYKEFLISELRKEYIYIQIGNSADPSNNHFDILRKLEKYKLKNIKIYCPLSYGDMEYAKKVIKEGEKIFKDNFIPLSEFMEYDKYLEFLSKIDIAIFAHDRQQAVGNITSLLSMKKTVYLKGSVTTYKMLKDLGIKVKDFNKFENLEKFNDDILEKNKEIIKERFSEKRLIEGLKNIFEN